MLTIRKNDTVKVMAGKDRGKTGRVLSTDPARKRITVEQVMVIKRHTRPNPQKSIKGGIVERESTIHISNVMLVCPSCGPTRPKVQTHPDGKKTRACRKCGNSLD